MHNKVIVISTREYLYRIYPFLDVLILKGKLGDNTNPKASFKNHTLLISYTEKIVVGEDEKNEVLLKPSEKVVNIEDDGDFKFEIPNKEDLDDSLLIEVLAPDGEVLADREYAIKDLKEDMQITINVKPKIFSEVPESEDKDLGKKVKLAGIVLDEHGKKKVSNKQVVIWARRIIDVDSDTTSEAKNPEIVLATRTDSEGYFSGDYPKGQYAEAYGIVSIGKNEKVPIHLEDGTFPRLPKKVVLVVKMEGTDDESGTIDDKEGKMDGCASCRTAMVPRAPDTDDLTNSPGTYSADLGGGRCVDFTVPNRALEEFSYYMVVRTTEPEIKGLTLAEPKRLPDSLIKLISSGDPGSTLTTRAMEIRTSSSTARDDGERQPQDRSDSITSSDVESIETRRVLGPTASISTISPTAVSKIVKGINPVLLKEIVRDPDNFTPHALVKAERVSKINDIAKTLEIFTKTEPSRANLSVRNPVDWDNEPTFYQATTIAHGHLLHFKQVWKADGYSLGDLLYSLPLAPCQKKQIAVIDWDRREAAGRTEQLEEEERLAAMLSRDRDISEVVSSALSENVRGGSEANTWGVAGGVGAAVGPVLIGVAGGYGSSNSTAWQNSSRSIAANSLQQLRDKTMQAASAVRNQRSTVVQTVQQGESVRVQTEVIANHNHCHSITVQYFQVLRHLQVSQELVDVQECLFIPLLMSRFDFSKTLRWKDSLRTFLRDRSLAGGFDAIARIQSNYEGSDFPTGRYADELIEDLDGDMRITFHITRPQDKNEEFDPDSWTLIARLTGTGIDYWYNRFLKGQVDKDRTFQAQIAPRIAESFVRQMKFEIIDKNNSVYQIQLDTTLVSRYEEGVPLYISLRSEGTLTPIKRENIKAIRISTSETLPPNSKVIVNTASFRYRTKYSSHFLFNGYRVMNDLLSTDDVVISTPLDRWELRNPRGEDREISKKLVDHLNEHIEYYHRIIWQNMDPARRYMLLDGFIAPNSNGKSVASVVENRLIGIVGNCLVMPVARGFHLDPTYRQDEEHKVDLLHLYAPTTPIPPMRISLPTRGVFAESVMGSCNSCETKDDTKFWRFEESPCGDEPTLIQPVSTESRRAEPGDLKPQPFPTPMINLQNAPAAPDPTGLAAALKVLGSPDLFRDITGLEQNQKNALAAFTSSLDAAKFFAGTAAKLAQQKALSQDIDKVIQKVRQAEREGLISKDDASKLVNAALSGMVGQETRAEKKLTDEPEVKNLLNSASESPSADVSLSRQGEAIDIKRSTTREGSSSFDINIPGVIPVLAQPSSMSCWAAVTTMMLSWRDQTSYTIKQAIDLVGSKYSSKLPPPKTNDVGLFSSEKEQFLADAGLVGEPPMNYSVEGLKVLLQRHGPIWATTDEDPSAKFAIHARIITGMFGDGTADGTSLRIIDPNGGRQYTETFRSFAKKFEEEAKAIGARDPLRIQIVHFAQTINTSTPSEGSSGLILSGSSWVSKFRGSKDVSDLEPTFRSKVQQFIGAMEDAGATVSVSSTYRPPERAYLMHWAWKIVKENYDAQKVPSKAGVSIDWWHGDQAKSKQAAQEMVNGYAINNLDVAPSLTSRHTERKAIDMNISWTGNLEIKKADGTTVKITSTPRDGTNADLIEVGKTYEVIHFTDVDKDKPHWSTDGK